MKNVITRINDTLDSAITSVDIEQLQFDLGDIFRNGLSYELLRLMGLVGTSLDNMLENGAAANLQNLRARLNSLQHG